MFYLQWFEINNNKIFAGIWHSKLIWGFYGADIFLAYSKFGDITITAHMRIAIEPGEKIIITFAASTWTWTVIWRFSTHLILNRAVIG